MRRILISSLACVLCLSACGSDNSTEQLNPPTAKNNDGAGSTPNATPPEPPANDTTPETDAARLPFGAACTTDMACGRGQICITELPGGYCSKACTSHTQCGTEGTCWSLGANRNGVCLKSCTDNSNCRAGLICDSDQTCFPPPPPAQQPEPPAPNTGCQAASDCAAGQTCSAGVCVANLDPAPSNDIPACDNIPSWRCEGTRAYCGEIVPFMPAEGDGYWNYPLNGETTANQYRSFARRDLMLLIKYAAAQTRCLSAGWTTGNGLPLGLGDMSESTGAIPGTSIGEPGHPAGTHVNGFDMDIAYYQKNTPNNILRPVCPHADAQGAETYHCTAAPTLLDVWRTALFIGKLHATPQLRVIGVDGKVGPLVESAMDTLCEHGWLSGTPCTGNRSLTYETTDEGRGWFLFHLHHLHVSTRAPSSSQALTLQPPADTLCLQSDAVAPCSGPSGDGPTIKHR